MKDYKHIGASTPREPLTLSGLVITAFMVFFSPVILGFVTGIMYSLLETGFLSARGVMTIALTWLAK